MINLKDILISILIIASVIFVPWGVGYLASSFILHEVIHTGIADWFLGLSFTLLTGLFTILPYGLFKEIKSYPEEKK